MNKTTVTNRHLNIAAKLPTVQAFIAYCEAREAGKSHIYAMHKAHKAGK
jgi:hypothetical protein